MFLSKVNIEEQNYLVSELGENPMYGNGNQPIIVLKEGTERTKDKEAQFNNIAAAKAVADAVRSTLGPKGMDKMLVNTIGDVVITNDGVTILKEIDVQHPAAKMVVEVAKTQDSECGDGTTTAVVLAGELLKQSEELIDANVHPTVITNGFKLAAAKSVEVLNSIAVDAKKDDILQKVAITTLTGKSIGEEHKLLADIVVKAAKAVEENGRVDTKNIRVQKKVGGVIGDTYLVEGVVIDKEAVHSRMPKKVENAKIALFSCGLEVKKTEFDAQIQITDPASMGNFLAEEENTMKEIVDKIKSVGANVVFCSKAVDELVQHYMAKVGILGYRRLKESDLEAISKATGANIIGNIHEITEKDLGNAGLVEEKLVGEDGMAFITGCKNPKAITIFVRGGTEHVLEEVERSLNDAIRTVGVTLEDGKVVAGAGAPEIELSLRLGDYASSVGGREQLAIEKFAKALEIIPWTLAENAGIDAIDSIIKLKNAHEKQKDGKYYGIDLSTGEAVDMLKLNVVEPLRVKVQAINSAEEVANMILRIDDVIASRRSAPPQMPPGGMGGMPPM
jgi:thermosome